MVISTKPLEEIKSKFISTLELSLSVETAMFFSLDILLSSEYRVSFSLLLMEKRISFWFLLRALSITFLMPSTLLVADSSPSLLSIL